MRLANLFHVCRGFFCPREKKNQQKISTRGKIENAESIKGDFAVFLLEFVDVLFHEDFQFPIGRPGVVFCHVAELLQ